MPDWERAYDRSGLEGDVLRSLKPRHLAHTPHGVSKTHVDPARLHGHIAFAPHNTTAAARLRNAAPGPGRGGRRGLLAAVDDHSRHTTPYEPDRAGKPSGLLRP